MFGTQPSSSICVFHSEQFTIISARHQKGMFVTTRALFSSSNVIRMIVVAQIATALGDIAHAKGITQLAKETGITPDGLYKTLSPMGNPSFYTVQKVIKAFGLKLDVATASA